MAIYIMLLRLIHIFAGVFWAGSMFLLVGYLQPTVKVTAPEGPKFMQKLMGGSLATMLAVTPGLNVLAGLLLFWNDSGGLQLTWLGSAPGIGFTLGGLAGLVALFIGLFVTRPANLAVVALGKEIAAAGKPPTKEQMAKMGTLQERMTSATLAVVIALAVAITMMAVARYL